MIPLNTQVISADGELNGLICYVSEQLNQVAIANLAVQNMVGRRLPKPSRMRLDVLLKKADKNQVTLKPYMFPAIYTDPRSVYSGDVLNTWIKEAEKNYLMISPIVADEEWIENYLFYRLAGPKISAIAKESAVTVQHVRRTLNRYFVNGSTVYALMPEHCKKGSNYQYPQLIAEPGKKRGPSNAKTEYRNITEEDKGIILKWLDTPKFKAVAHLSMAAIYRAYDNNIQVSKSIDHQFPDGPSRPSALAERFCISEASFTYFLKNALTDREWNELRKGAIDTNNNYDPKLGMENDDARRAGQRYVVDATQLPIYLRFPYFSKLGFVVARPWCYFVRDAFSGMIVGFYLSFSPPNWRGVAMALFNACTNKKEFCARYGVIINDGDWDCEFTCDEVEIDNAAEHSVEATSRLLLEQIGIKRVMLTRVAYGRGKGGVESTNRQIDIFKIHGLPGAVRLYKPHEIPHASRLAELTYEDMVVKIIHFCLEQNSRPRAFDIIDKHMADAGIAPTNKSVWDFSLKNYGSSLSSRKRTQKDLAWSLLPKVEASTCDKGFKIKQQFYRSDYANERGWFSRSANRPVKKIEMCIYDMSTDYVWFKHDGEIHEAIRTTRSRRMSNMHWEVALARMEREAIQLVKVREESREQRIKLYYEEKDRINKILDDKLNTRDMPKSPVAHLGEHKKIMDDWQKWSESEDVRMHLVPEELREEVVSHGVGAALSKRISGNFGV